MNLDDGINDDNNSLPNLDDNDNISNIDDEEEVLPLNQQTPPFTSSEPINQPPPIQQSQSSQQQIRQFGPQEYEQAIVARANNLPRFKFNEIINKRLIPVGWPDHEFNRIYNLYDVHMILFNWAKTLFQNSDFKKDQPLQDYNYNTNPKVKVMVDRVNDAIDLLCLVSNYILTLNPFVVLHPKERLNVIKLENKRIRKIQMDSEDQQHHFVEEDDKQIYDNDNYEASSENNNNSSSHQIDNQQYHQSINNNQRQPINENNINDEEDTETVNNDEEDAETVNNDDDEEETVNNNEQHTESVNNDEGHEWSDKDYLIEYCESNIKKIVRFINKLMKTKFWYYTGQTEEIAFSIAVLIYNCVTELFYFSKYDLAGLRDGRDYQLPVNYNKKNIMGLPSSIDNGYRYNYLATVQKILELKGIKPGQRDTAHYADAIMFAINNLRGKRKYKSSYPALLPQDIDNAIKGRYTLSNPSRANEVVVFSNNNNQASTISYPHQQQHHQSQSQVQTQTQVQSQPQVQPQVQQQLPPQVQSQPAVQNTANNNINDDNDENDIFTDWDEQNNISHTDINSNDINATFPSYNISNDNDYTPLSYNYNPPSPLPSNQLSSFLVSERPRTDRSLDDDEIFGHNLIEEYNKNDLIDPNEYGLKKFVLQEGIDIDINTEIREDVNKPEEIKTFNDFMKDYAKALIEEDKFYDIQCFMFNSLPNKKIVLKHPNETAKYSTFKEYIERHHIYLPLDIKHYYDIDKIPKQSITLKFYGYDYNLNAYSTYQLKYEWNKNKNGENYDIYEARFYLRCPTIHILNELESRTRNILRPKLFSSDWNHVGYSDEDRKIICKNIYAIPNVKTRTQEWLVLEGCDIDKNPYLKEMPDNGLFKYYNYPFYATINGKTFVVINRVLRDYVFLMTDSQHPEILKRAVDQVLIEGSGKKKMQKRKKSIEEQLIKLLFKRMKFN